MTCPRRLLVALAACLALPAASAQADVVLNPSATFAAGSQAMQTAQAIAKQHWGTDPCSGQVSLAWTALAAQINATSTWANPKSSYDNPDLNTSCHIDFNSGMDFDWEKFCTVVVHEYGHLSGKPHSPDPTDVMAAFYSTPLPECMTTTGAAPAAPAAPVAASTTPARAASVRRAFKRVVKRGRLRHESKPHKRHKHHR